MPIYEYRCPACGAETEKMRRVSDRNAGPACPTCGETMVLGLSAPGRVGGQDGGSVSVSGGGSCGTGFT